MAAGGRPQRENDRHRADDGPFINDIGTCPTASNSKTTTRKIGPAAGKGEGLAPVERRWRTPIVKGRSEGGNEDGKYASGPAKGAVDAPQLTLRIPSRGDNVDDRK